MMRIVHVSYSYDPMLNSEEELIEKHYTVTGWAEALQRKGGEVIVVSRFSRDGELNRNGVSYHFIRDRLPPILRSRHLPFKLFKRIRSLNADIVHLHHLTHSIQTFVLRGMLHKKTALIVQHHGGVTPDSNRRKLHNLFNRVADGFFFTTVEQGRDWLMSDRLSAKVMPVMEGATSFNFADRDATREGSYQNRATARSKTGMVGSPVFLWVGRLDENKDPLTVLNGLEELFEKTKDASLYMIYSDDRLSNAVKEKIDNSAILRNKVHLTGIIDHNKMESFYNSADYFVLGSHYEGSGYALSEALRCGCIPIVTNIPSFRMMTNEGRLGALWEPGNKDSLVLAATSALNKSVIAEANACIDFYEQRLSFDAIAGLAIDHYRAVIKSRIEKKK